MSDGMVCVLSPNAAFHMVRDEAIYAQGQESTSDWVTALEKCRELLGHLGTIKTCLKFNGKILVEQGAG